MIAKMLHRIKKGALIQRKPDSKKIYIKGDYDRSSKAYSLIDFDDINREIFLKPITYVYID